MQAIGCSLLTALAMAACLQAPAVLADESKTVSLPRTAAVVGTELYFVTPKDGDTVPAEFVVRFGLRGMGVAPAGVMNAHTGHHHLLIDLDTPPDPSMPIPADANHVHFGGGQTETTLTLAPGKHTLQLNLADALHMQFDPPILSKKITVTVK
jgi:hypothetical protein